MEKVENAWGVDCEYNPTPKNWIYIIKENGEFNKNLLKYLNKKYGKVSLKQQSPYSISTYLYTEDDKEILVSDHINNHCDYYEIFKGISSYCHDKEDITGITLAY